MVPAAVHAQHPFAAGDAYDPAVPRPVEVLGHEVGERFTPHHVLMRYLERLAAASPRIRLDTVAHSVEGREVMLAIVTSEANHARLAQIRADNRLLADPRGGSTEARSEAMTRVPAIIWLGYTVHGPEASGVEAAIALLYQMAAGTDPETMRILERTVLLIDPLQNPDGHERHVQDVMRMRTALGVPVHPAATIHSGNWPGPRTSHYYFDLNRDWFTQSHPETRGRIATMLEWWPHVAVDLHEMSASSSYFFPPTMEPVNRLVHPNILAWWDVVAAGIMGAFDEHGWSYFRREGYDEFYPGYGSSWPIYTGAVGMTYEQASSRGGAIRRTDGTVQRLRDAAHHHYVASWATIRTIAERADERVRDYAEFRASAIRESRDAPLRTVLLARDGQGRADSLVQKLLQNGIEVGRVRSERRIEDALEYGATRAASIALPAGSYVVDLAQPQGRLARALLEPDAPLDSAFLRDELARRAAGESDRFYDLTAWSLPFLFRVQAWGTRGSIGPADAVTSVATAPAPPPRARYGYAFPPGTEASIRLLGALLSDSVRVWYAPHSFTSGATAFPDGAFLVRVEPNAADVHDVVRRHAAAVGAPVTALASAGVDAGTDLGSNSVIPLRIPRVALMGGAPISGQSFGYAWYALDQRLGVPSTRIDADAWSARVFADFNVIVVPSASPGSLTDALGTSGTEAVRAWVRAGGVLVTLDDATAWLASESLDLSTLRLAEDPEPDSTGRAPLPGSVPGAIARAHVDSLSPLMAGVREDEIPALVFTDRVYRVPEGREPGQLVARLAELPRFRIAGYFWPEMPARMAGTPYIWTEEVGRGRVIGFTGDPTFRDMWRGHLAIFANAILINE